MIFIIWGVTVSCDNTYLQLTRFSYRDAFYLRRRWDLQHRFHCPATLDDVPLIKLPPPKVRLSIHIRVLLRCV
jgi:hypothetical protein